MANERHGDDLYAKMLREKREQENQIRSWRPLQNPGYHWRNKWWILLGILTYPFWGTLLIFRVLHHIATGGNNRR